LKEELTVMISYEFGLADYSLALAQ